MLVSQVKKLNHFKIEVLTEKNHQDYIDFFDRLISQTNNRTVCYCTMWNMTEEEIEAEIFKPVKEKHMRLDESSRKAAEKLLEKNAIHGYLAYFNCNPIGWCNAGDRNGYVFLGRHMKNDSSNPDGKIMSIVGIEVERTFQMNGVADAMVKYVCSEAKKAGYECVEAYPNTRGCMDIQTYKHLIKLYENNGFVDEFISGAGRIMRKDLKQSAEEITN